MSPLENECKSHLPRNAHGDLQSGLHYHRKNKNIKKKKKINQVKHCDETRMMVRAEFGSIYKREYVTVE